MNLLKVKNKISDLNRFRTILGIIFEAGGGALIKKMKLSYLTPWKCRIHCFFNPPKTKNCLIRMQGETEALSPDVLRLVLEKLGPTFIKLGQVLSVRADVVGEEISTELSKLQSDAPPFSYEKARQIIIEELGTAPEKLFKSFEKKPIAAASLAQVHRAILKDGAVVAVKVQRPHIQEIIERDIHILFALAHAIDRFIPESRPYQPVRVIKEFADWTMRELDFTTEGHNADRFRSAFKDNAHIHIPAIVWQHTTARVLTMEFVHGVKADDLAGMRRMRTDPKELAKFGVEALLQQFFIDGFFHADPHPGNFFALPQNVLCFHDFGMVGYLQESQRRELVSCFIAFTNKDIERYIKHLLHLATTDAKSDTVGFEKDVATIMNELLFSPTRTSIAWVFFRAINAGARRGIRFPADLALFGKAIITTEAMGLKLRPDFDFNKELTPFVRRIWKEYFSPEKNLKALESDFFDYLALLKNFPERTQRMLTKIESGEIGIKLDATDLLGIKTEFDRQNDLRILGTATISLFIISNIFSYLEGVKSINGIKFSSISFIILAFLLFWLVARVVKKPK